MTSPARTAPIDEASRRRVLESLDFAFARPKTRPWYRAALAVVALFMMLLPAVYLAVVGAVAYAVYWHAVNDLWIFNSVRGRTGAFLYGIPIAIGGILVFFLLKPFLAKPNRLDSSVPLDPKREPYVFAFIAALCRTVGAPRPKSIHVDCDVNASVGFHQGTAGLFGGRRALTIGLPLAGNLTLPQLTGVLAHELGHLAQGAGMRMGFAIRTVNSWFWRAVHERDRWDEKLVATSEGGKGWGSIVAGLSRLFIGLTRKLLSVFLWIGHAMSCSFSRQMELDADGFEVGVVGSETFTATMRAMPPIGAAWRMASSRLAECWQERRLADDLPALVRHELESLSPEVLAKVRHASESVPTTRFATHPSDADRVAAATAADAPAQFSSDLPATALFQDFAGLCRDASRRHYRETIGIRFDQRHLVPVADLLGWGSNVEAELDAQHRFFFGCANLVCPIPVSGAAVRATSQPPVHQAFEQRRAAAARAGEQATPRLQAAYQAWDDHRAAESRVALLHAGVKKPLLSVGLDDADLEACREASKSALEQLDAARRDVAPLLATLAARLHADLAASHGRKAETDALLTAATTLAEAMPHVLDAGVKRAALIALAQNAAGRGTEAPFTQTLDAVARAAWTSVTRVRKALASTAYPFEHRGKPGLTMGQFVVPELGASNDLASIVSAAQTAEERMLNLESRVLGRLALIAEEVEHSLGLGGDPPSHDGI